jgi:hypothetical protein
MSNSPDPDLIKVSEIFLVPSSFLVAALGTADTNLHRAAISLLGFVIGVLWWICSREALSEVHQPGAPTVPNARPRRTRILTLLPLVFVVGWLLSTVVHAALWNRPLGG